MTVSSLPDAPRTSRHLYEIDVVRILTFACVIAVHTTSHTVAGDDIPLYGFLALAHFTRQVFFALSGFVLVYSYLAKPVPMKRFWPRRFLLVGVPYLVWSAIYFIVANIYSPQGSLLDMAGRFVIKVATGTAWYHLYFLLVTMQVYLLVPAIVWLVKKSRGHHVAMLAVFGVFQLVITGVYAYAGWLPGWLDDYSKVYFFSYLFFIMLGAVAADHAEQLLAWVASHRRMIAIIVVATAVLTIAVFAFQAAGMGYSLYRAGTPLQPVIMVWAVAVALGFLAIGSWWAARRQSGGFVARAVDVASDRSFGIFLSHPLVLWLILLAGDGLLAHLVPTPWLTLVAYVLVVVGAVAITELARRSPASLLLTGRPWRPKKKPESSQRPESVSTGAASAPPLD
ncbi:MAG: acyltransferase [Microbacteriaceae bacterium]|nr:acyltransferase [Microbacteriaceae bacterium]